MFALLLLASSVRSLEMDNWYLNDENKTQTATPTATEVPTTSKQATIVGVVFLVLFLAGVITFFMINRRKASEMQSILGGSVMSEASAKQIASAHGLL